MSMMVQATTSAHLGWFDYSIFAVYLATTLGISFAVSKGQKNIKNFLLAGRSIGPVIVAITVLASVFSGVSYIGMPAEIYANGLGYWLIAFSSLITTPVINAIFIPFFYRVKFYSAYQYFEARFSVGIRTLTAALFISKTLLWLSVAIYAPAIVLERVTGLPLWTSITIMGCFTTIIATVGGMKAVIWTDVLQFFVLVGGQFVIMVVAVSAMPDGLTGVYETARDAGRLSFDFSFDPTIRVTVWAIVLGGTVNQLVLLCTDQVSIQRYMTAKSMKTAKKAMWIKVFITIPAVSLFYLTGVVLFSFYHGTGQDPLASGAITKADQILPYFVVNELPRGFQGLLIAGIIAASMSVISSALNSMTTVSLVDLYGQFSKKELNEEKKVKYARTMSFAFGIIVTLLAFSAGRFGSLIEAPVKIFGMLGGAMLGLFLLGMLTERANAQGAIIGWITGTVATSILVFCTDVSFLWYSFTGSIVAFVVGWSCSFLWPDQDISKKKGLTWKSRYDAGDENE
jgi:SSS family transporter